MVEIDAERLDQVARSLQATPDEAAVAMRRALQTTSQRLRVRGARQLGLRSGRFVGRRVKTGTREGVRIWFGLNAVVAGAYVTPAEARAQMESRNGVTVRGRHYPKGFWIQPKNRRDPLAVVRRRSWRPTIHGGGFQRGAYGSKLVPIRTDIENQLRPILQGLHEEIPVIFEAEFARLLEVSNLRTSRAT